MNNSNQNSSFAPPSFSRFGGSKGRPTGLVLRACQSGLRWIGPNGFEVFDSREQLVQPCTPARRDLKIMIKTNDWWYQKGNNSSTTLIHTTGGSLNAVRRRT